MTTTKTSAYAKTNHANPICRIVAAFVMGVLALTLSACGTLQAGASQVGTPSTSRASQPQTLQAMLEQDPSSQQYFKQMAQEYATAVGQVSGCACTANVGCIDNQLQFVAYYQLTDEQLIAEGITGLFTGQYNTWQEIASQIIASGIDGRMVVSAITSLEQETGLRNITIAYALCDANGNVLGKAVYSDQGRVE